MYHAFHMLICTIVCLTIFEQGITAENPALARNGVKNVPINSGVITAALLKEFQQNTTNRTSLIDAISSPGVLPLPKSLENNDELTRAISSNKPLKNQRIVISGQPKTTSTTVPTTFLQPADRVKPKRSDDEEPGDTARAQQRQSENQFPFDFRNNFRDNFDGGFQGPGRQLSNTGGLFGGQYSFDSEIFRPFDGLDGQRSGLSGLAGDQDGLRGVGGRFSGRDTLFDGLNGANGANRPQFGSGAVNSPLDFNRFQNFGQFGFDGRGPESNRFINPIDPNIRSGLTANPDRFNNFPGQQDPRINLVQNFRNPDGRLRQNNFPTSNVNSQINDAGLNGPGGLQFAGRPFLDPAIPQNYPQNSFDPSSQRFRNTFPDDRNGQRLNYPPYFSRPATDVPSGPGPLGVGPIGSQNSSINGKINGANSQSPSSSRRSEDSAPKSTADDEISSVPGVQSLQERLEIEKLFYPAYDDYSDIRVSSDLFKQHLLASNIIEKHSKINVV